MQLEPDPLTKALSMSSVGVSTRTFFSFALPDVYVASGVANLSTCQAAELAAHFEQENQESRTLRPPRSPLVAGALRLDYRIFVAPTSGC